MFQSAEGWQLKKKKAAGEQYYSAHTNTSGTVIAGSRQDSRDLSSDFFLELLMSRDGR